jgi:hypothetical protein
MNNLQGVFFLLSGLPQHGPLYFVSGVEPHPTIFPRLDGFGLAFIPFFSRRDDRYPHSTFYHLFLVTPLAWDGALMVPNPKWRVHILFLDFWILSWWAWNFPFFHPWAWEEERVREKWWLRFFARLGRTCLGMMSLYPVEEERKYMRMASPLRPLLASSRGRLQEMEEIHVARWFCIAWNSTAWQSISSSMGNDGQPTNCRYLHGGYKNPKATFHNTHGSTSPSKRPFFPRVPKVFVVLEWP